MCYGKDDRAKNLVGLAFCVAGPVNRIAPGEYFRGLLRCSNSNANH